MIDKKLVYKIADDLDKYASVHETYNKHVRDQAVKIAMSKVAGEDDKKQHPSSVDLYGMYEQTKKKKKKNEDAEVSPPIKAKHASTQFYLNLAYATGLFAGAKKDE